MIKKIVIYGMLFAVAFAMAACENGDDQTVPNGTTQISQDVLTENNNIKNT